MDISLFDILGLTKGQFDNWINIIGMIIVPVSIFFIGNIVLEAEKQRKSQIRALDYLTLYYHNLLQECLKLTNNEKRRRACLEKFINNPTAENYKNAQNEPTYLMAPVKIIAEYKTYNMNTQKFENLLHKFFGTCCVSIDVRDNNGTRHIPHEWFQIPYDIINESIRLMISGEIINYKYDRNTKQIVKI